MSLITYHDLTQAILDYYGVDPSEEGQRYARRACLSGYRDLASNRRWSYFFQQGLINTSASYTTGTVVYTHTGGAYERVVTLTSGTWPTWAAFGRLLIGSVDYEIVDRKSATEITLSSNSNPGADVASTSYTIYRNTYPMPIDFVAAGEVINQGYALPLVYAHPEDWLAMQRIVSGPATPRTYAFTADPNYVGAMAIRLYPPPDAIYPLAFIYQRRPRSLSVLDVNAGTATVTSSSTTVTGAGTPWSSDHVGSVIRFSSSSTGDLPTGPDGVSPYSSERIITAVASATSLTIDQVTGLTYTGVKYRISDPVDIEDGAMTNFLYRLCEEHARIIRRMKPGPEEMMALDRARILAMESDSRSFTPRAAGVAFSYRPRLRDMPRGADVS